MVQLRKTVTIDATPEAVWEVLGDLSGTTEWLPGTVAARMEGSTRICTTADGFDIREEISDYVPSSRSYRYRHLEVPLPVSESAGSFTVEPDDGGALVVLQSEFEPLDAAEEGQVQQLLEGALERALESLKQRVERGLRWDAR